MDTTPTGLRLSQIEHQIAPQPSPFLHDFMNEQTDTTPLGLVSLEPSPRVAAKRGNPGLNFRNRFAV